MEFVATLVQILNVIAAIAVIVLVLLQHGKGADMGAAFGGGSAGSLFGSAGSANFLSRATAFAATVFFVSCLALVLISSKASQKANELGVMEGAISAVASQPAQASGPAQKKIPD
jgi:preprotein translocase subunit SecG